MSLLFQNWSNADLETTRGAYIFLIDKLMKEKNDIPRDKNYQKNFIALQKDIDRAIDLKKIIEDELSFAK
ncbi:MAG: hypothetical protein ACOYM0_01235 [Bacteroidales bacterium]